MGLGDKELDYFDWLFIAGTGGKIDWDNPPPREILTEEFCIAALEDAPENLGKIPVELRTANVCFKAVYTDDAALQFVPENLREEVKARKDAITEEQWLYELTNYYNGNHYLKLPEKLLKAEFCRTMVELNGYTIDLVPEELKTPELEAIAKETEKNYWKHSLKRGGPRPLVKSGTQIVMEESLSELEKGEKRTESEQK